MFAFAKIEPHCLSIIAFAKILVACLLLAALWKMKIQKTAITSSYEPFGTVLF
jgi:hypothetical protein